VMASRIVYNLSIEVSKARRLGSYQLEERLGAGGMGEVWRASHILLARPAAVKLIRPEVFQEAGPVKASEAIARFEREAQVTASLRSSHTVQLYDFGVTAEGAPYYVMELIAGIDLDTIVRSHGPQPAERVIHLLRQACESLAEAHAAGLVHRDIKPANFMLSIEGVRPDYLKVLDFGLVTLKPELHTEEAGPTRPQLITGTPAFMAPESISADQPVDHRADLYALGCIAYWLLTGRLVFEDESHIVVLAAHAQKPPIPVSQVVETPISDELDRLILDCLAKKPGDRPQTALELRRKLEACPIEREWTEKRAENWWRIHHPEITATVASFVSP
jgi:serine/threonine protein kinase